MSNAPDIRQRQFDWPKLDHTSHVLSSSFARDTGVPQIVPVTTSDKIIFHRVVCTIKEELGNYNLMEQATDEHSLIARQVMQLPSSECGKTKDIYIVRRQPYHSPCYRSNFV